MTRSKRAPGRPMERGFPPRLDATADEIATAVLTAPVGRSESEPMEFRCHDCAKVVEYPNTLSRMGRCKECAPDVACDAAYNAPVTFTGRDGLKRYTAHVIAIALAPMTTSGVNQAQRAGRLACVWVRQKDAAGRDYRQRVSSAAEVQAYLIATKKQILPRPTVERLLDLAEEVFIVRATARRNRADR